MSDPGHGRRVSGTVDAPSRHPRAGAVLPLPRLVWVFVAVALLALPIFAHGCHGDDIDHEPLLIPDRLFSDDR